MKAGWVTLKLGDVCTLQRGFDLPKAKRSAGQYPLVTSSGPTDTHNEHRVHGPGVATGRSGSIGEVFFIDRHFWPLNTALYVKDFHGNDVRFIFYFLKYFDLARFASGAGVPTLNRNHVHDELVSIPTSLGEQKRIVAVLDEAFAALDHACTHAEANLKNARELFERERETQLALNDATWTDTKVGSLCTKMEYGTAEKSLPTGEVPVLRMGNLQDGELDWTKLVYSNNQNDISKLLLKDGDVLFNRTNSAEHVGKTAIFREKREAIFAGYLIRLHLVSELVNPEFMNLFLNSKIARDYGKSVMGKSVNQANISGSKLKQYPIQLPPLAKQVDIVDRLLALKAQSAALQKNYQKKLLDIEDLRQSLLQKAFSGELT